MLQSILRNSTHYNKLHIRNLEISDLADRLRPFLEAEGYSVDQDKLLALAPLLQPRITTLDEVVEWTRFIFVDEVNPTFEELIVKGLDGEQSLRIAKSFLELLTNKTEYTQEALEQPIRDLAESMEVKLGQVFGVLRIAITQQNVSPPLIECLDILEEKKPYTD